MGMRLRIREMIGKRKMIRMSNMRIMKIWADDDYGSIHGQIKDDDKDREH